MVIILGKKLEMSQVFNEKGEMVPVTIIEAGPCFVIQIKTKEKDGYEAVQIGFEEIKKPNKLKKTMTGKPFRHLKEFKSGQEKFEIGRKLDVSIFKEGEEVKISGVSKGKGFQGGVKRWGFSGRNTTHGAKHEERTIGSVGSSNVERVFKGKRMPGRMGGERVTVTNLKVVKIDVENNLLAVKGAVPGRRGTLLEIRE